MRGGERSGNGSKRRYVQINTSKQSSRLITRDGKLYSSSDISFCSRTCINNASNLASISDAAPRDRTFSSRRFSARKSTLEEEDLGDLRVQRNRGEREGGGRGQGAGGRGQGRRMTGSAGRGESLKQLEERSAVFSFGATRPPPRP
jgi:hypothetical protein